MRLALLWALFATFPVQAGFVVKHAAIYDVCSGVTLRKLPNQRGIISLYGRCPGETDAQATPLIDGCSPQSVTWNATLLRYTVTCMGGAAAYVYIGPPR